MYIKPEKNDTTAMTAATNEACIKCLGENYYLMGEGMTLLTAENVNLLRTIFLVGKVSNFFAVSWDSPLYPRFPIKV